MEYCKGGDLFKKINELADKDQSFSEKEAVKIYFVLFILTLFNHY